MGMETRSLTQRTTRDREAARAWALEMARQRDVLYLDTETTGLERDAEVVEIAVVDRDGRPLLDTLVRPNKPIPAGTTAFHGIGDAMVADAPGWPEVYFALLDLLNERSCPCVVVYNASFDRRVIDYVNRSHGLTPVVVDWHCAMIQYAAFAGEPGRRSGQYRWHSLERASSALGLPRPIHRARGDALACRAVVLAMAAGHPGSAGF